MKKQTFHILSFFFFLMAQAPACTFGQSFDKKKAEQLIVGQWQQTGISVASDEIKGFNEAMDNPMMQSSFKKMSDGMSCQFDSGGRFIVTVLSTIDTARYQITDDGYFLIYSKLKNEPPRKNKILQLSSDTLIFTNTRQANTPEMLPLLSVLNAKKDTTKTITYTYTYSKVKEANAPWTLIKSDLPQKRWVENLVLNDSTFFTIVSDPSSQNDDSIYASNNDCTNWLYGGYAIPKSEQEYRKIMKKVGSKVFIETAKSVFAIENKGKSWNEISGLPTDFFGFGLPEFATAATRIYAGSGSKLLASGDNAVTWVSLKTPLQKDDDILTLATNNNNIIIGGARVIMNASSGSYGAEAFLLLSADDGQTWKDIQLTSDDYPGIMANYVAIVGSSIIMSTQYGMFRSDLQQINWTPVKGLSSTPANNPFTADEPTGSAGETILASGTNIFYGGANGMFVSDNGGESWTEVNNKELRKGVNSFVIANAQIIALTAESKLFQASVKDLEQYMKKMGK